MRVYLKSAMALILVAGVAGCQSTPRPKFNSGPPPVTQASLQGNWRATEGPLLASFTGDKFRSINTENSQVVAAGVFKVNSDQDIRLEWVGALSGRSSATCKMSELNLMSCTPSNGSGFQLRRV